MATRKRQRNILQSIFMFVALVGSAMGSSNLFAVQESSSVREQPRLLQLAAFIEDEKRPQDRPITEEKKEKEKTSWAFYIDNDILAPSSNDRDYTGGLSLTLSGARVKDYLISLDPLLNTLDRWIGPNDNSSTVLHSFEFGMNVFTPEDIETKETLPNDRPYASLVYIANSRQRVYNQDRHSLITTLTVGALGLDVPGDFQNGVHSIFGASRVKGWRNQISDGGEPTFRYSVAKQRIQWARYGEGNNNYEIKTAVRGSVGYLTGVAWGISGRWGNIRTPWWTFNPHLSDYAEKSTPLASTSRSKNEPEFYFWAGANLHLRAYNALLQGQFRDSAVTFDNDELNHVIAETWVGITKEFTNGYRMSYLIRSQTSEIKSGPGSRNPIWGGVIIGKAF